ncbi:MAG: peptidoglycan DD-metalloendopeptidase family protein [Bacillota bacterium]|nr:peptidoglycan DD-metalloendopeptidase family protein [Bacillota bacterium]
MKTRNSVDKTEPVPTRVKCIVVTAIMILLGASVCVGSAIAPEAEIPVMLANGEVITPPWYITIDGKRSVLVESEEAAEEAVQEVIEEYEGDSEEVINICVEEDTGAEQMDIKTGDEPPDILSVDEAKEVLFGDDNEDGAITVVVTKEATKREVIEHEEKYSPSSELYAGQTKVEIEGEDGIKEITEIVTSENGETIETEVVKEKIIKEPVDRIIKTGTITADGRGGSEGAIDAGVSYDESATYDMLNTPVPFVNISSPFGPRWGSFHSGVDFALAQGKPIYAADSGIVYYSGYSGGYGNLIKVDHGNGMQTYYAHCSEINVCAGQSVTAGETIGLIGSTGNSTGPHLHFEVIVNGSRVDPLDFLGF